MDRIVELVQKFLKAEYEAFITVCTEPDPEKAYPKIQAVNEFFAKGAGTNVEIPDEIGDWEAKAVKKAVVRPLFLVKEFHNGETYQAVLGEEFIPQFGTAYDETIFLADRGGPKIISRYQACPHCDATGEIDGKGCPECDGAGWINKLAGEAIDFKKLGKPTVVKKLQRPEVARFQKDYDSY